MVISYLVKECHSNGYIERYIHNDSGCIICSGLHMMCSIYAERSVAGVEE